MCVNKMVNVLFVDDDKNLLEMLVDNFDYLNSFTANTVNEYLALIANQGLDNIQYLVMDYNLNDTEHNGATLLYKTRIMYPNIDKPVLILFSGNATSLPDEQLAKLQDYKVHILSKNELSKLEEILR